jgi:hypothetical protein
VNPDLFALVAASVPAKALLGANPVRFYAFGEADERTPKPYGVWQTVYGSPENLLAGVPTDDRWGVQIDAYDLTGPKARALGEVLRDLLEPHGYIVSWNGEFREPVTRLYRYSFTIEFMTTR